ncbi:MAG: hypothetical protein WC123_05370 [Bacilli bacterium]
MVLKTIRNSFSIIENSELEEAIYSKTSNKKITSSLLKLIESVKINEKDILLTLFYSPSLGEYRDNNIRIMNYLIKRQNSITGHQDVLKYNLPLDLDNPKMTCTICYSNELDENQIIMVNVIKDKNAY